MAQAVDVLQKVKGLEIVEDEFTPDGETKPIRYRKAYLTITARGEDYRIPLQMEKAYLLALELAEDVE